ncbi:hypothetical protein ABK040_016325 [Willaertia magna]
MVLQVTVNSGNNLAIRDSNSFSDPYVVISLVPFYTNDDEENEKSVNANNKQTLHPLFKAFNTGSKLGILPRNFRFKVAKDDSNNDNTKQTTIKVPVHQKQKTKIIKKNLNPTWNETFTCPLITFDLLDKIAVRFDVFDHDLIGKDEAMGFTEFPLSLLSLYNIEEEQTFQLPLFDVESGELTITLKETTPNEMNIPRDPVSLVLAAGNGVEGQLGVTPKSNYGSIVKFPEVCQFPEDKQIKLVASGTLFTLIATKDNELYFTGKYSVLSGAVDTFTKLNSWSSENKSIKSIACGYCHALILTEDGELYGFGSNKECQLGNIEKEDNLEIVKIDIQPIITTFGYWDEETDDENTTKVDKIFCTQNRSVLLTNTNRMYATGILKVFKYNSDYASNFFSLGNFTRIRGNVKDVGMGYGFTVIVTLDNEMYGIGDYYGFRFGVPMIVTDKENVYRNVFHKAEWTKVDFQFPSPIKKVVCTYGGTFAILENGEIYATGENTKGELGMGEKFDYKALMKKKFNEEKDVDCVKHFEEIFLKYEKELENGQFEILDDCAYYTQEEKKAREEGLFRDGKWFTQDDIDMEYNFVEGFKKVNFTLPENVTIVDASVGRNHIVIKTSENEFYFLGHFDDSNIYLGGKRSIKVFTKMDIDSRFNSVVCGSQRLFFVMNDPIEKHEKILKFSYQNDCHLDKLIINAINNNGDDNNCKQLTNIKASKRVVKIWKSVQGMMLPFELKEVIRSELNKIKDVDGKVIVNVDADLGGYLQ